MSTSNIFITVGSNDNFEGCPQGIYTAQMIDLRVNWSFDIIEVKAHPCTGPSFPIEFKRSDCSNSEPAYFKINGEKEPGIRPSQLGLKKNDRLAIIPKQGD